MYRCVGYFAFHIDLRCLEPGWAVGFEAETARDSHRPEGGSGDLELQAGRRQPHGAQQSVRFGRAFPGFQVVRFQVCCLFFLESRGCFCFAPSTSTSQTFASYSLTFRLARHAVWVIHRFALDGVCSNLASSQCLRGVQG